MSKIPKIVIIGAGAAGIAAAVRLKEKGFTDITVLEAEQRIGGRIHSVEFGSGFVDLGAQWCHGEENNIIYEMVEDLGLLGPSTNTYTDNEFYKDGKKIDRCLTDKLFKAAFKIIDCEHCTTCEESGQSFGQYFEQTFNEKIKKDFKTNPKVLCLLDDFTDWFHNFLMCYEAAPNWFDISISNNEYEKCKGDPLLQWKDKGFKIALDVLMKKYPEESEEFNIDENLMMGKEVSCIHWNISDPKYEVEIHCTDRSVYKANHVIVTISLGGLKRFHKSLFDPELPDRKLTAVESLGFGIVTKIFLEFSEKWWADDTKGFCFLWNECVRDKVHKSFPQYVKEDGMSWMEGVFGFYVIDSNPNVLLGWLTGCKAADAEALTAQEMKNACMFILEQFLGSIYQVTYPEKVVFSKWNTNPNFLGVWSYRSMETEKQKTGAAVLAEPIRKRNKNVILFAGEATHAYYFSTVHGAIETGFREADRIADSYKMCQASHRKIIIVGGGAAGLGAARTLMEREIFDFLILEADNRLGGRIKTVEFEGRPLEIGAQWIHGSGNTIYEIAEKCHLISLDKSHEATGLYVRDDGYIFSDDIVKWVDFRVGRILEDCELFTNALEHPSSVGDYLEEKFLENLNDLEEPSERENCWDLLDWHLRFQNIDNSCNSLKNLSAKEWGKYFCPGLNGQEHTNLKRGFQSVAEELVRDIDTDKVKLNTPVGNIKWKDNDNIVTITCKGNEEETYTCDHVLVTCSLGVLKHDLPTMFSPQLPENIRDAIENMGFDGVGKVYLVFENKWWDASGFQLIWRKNVTVEGEQSWTRFISGIDSVYNHPNILVAWVGGIGVEMMESLPEETVGRHCVDLLRRFLKKKDIPYPVNVIRTSWLGNPRVRGGYSYSTPKCDSSGMGRSQLLKAAMENDIPRVLFAGEAVHPTHFSTVHGAFESGRSQIEKLLGYLKAVDGTNLTESREE